MIDEFETDAKERSIDPSLRRANTEWASLVALRELIGWASKGETVPTYLQTLLFASKIFPRLFGPDQSLLFRQEESDTAREYRQAAAAESKIQKKIVTPISLLEVDMEVCESRIKNESENDKLRQRLSRLKSAWHELKTAEHSENQLILRDALRTNKEYPISGTGKDYREFQLPMDRVLRIRVLHPDEPEHLMGADVVYENYWDEKRVVRLAAVQYKIWEKKILYYDERMGKQLQRLREALCRRDLCKSSSFSKRKAAYRLPYCAGFLRPTDKLQSSDSRFVSTGYHIPVCVVERSWEDGIRGGKVIRSKNVRSEAVTQKVFEELFNSNMLGSRYMTYGELEKLYKETKVLDANERIVIHAQEFGIEQ